MGHKTSGGKRWPAPSEIPYRPSAFMTDTASARDLDRRVVQAFQDVFARAQDIRGSDAYFIDRVGSAIFYRIPQLLSLGRDLGTMNAVEIGCGRGTKSVCWAPLFKTYMGCDIDATLIEEARSLASACSSRARFQVANGAEALSNPERYGLSDQIDCVIAYAVLEHLTLAEREAFLTTCRTVLAGHGLLIICEAPNRLIRYDPHSSALPFFQTLPPALALKYIGRSPRSDARALANGTEEELHRFGSGVSYHEFDLFLADQDGNLPEVVGGGWDVWAAADEPVRPDEVDLETFMRVAEVPAHPSFSRYWIDVIFDFRASMPANSYKRPILIGAERSAGVKVSEAGQWALANYISDGAELRFRIRMRSPLYVQLDLAASHGEFVISDPDQAAACTFSAKTLRKSRFSRWHSKAQIDLTAFSSASDIIIKPSAGTVSVDGIIAR